MDTVSVAELKSKLSHYLREVRAGRSFTVTSRDIPVATLRPWRVDDVDELEPILPDPDATPLYQPLFEPAGKPLPDAAELLRRDRDDRDARLSAIVAGTSQAHTPGEGREGQSGEAVGEELAGSEKDRRPS
ncbi:MAG TPA: type II toxin-antitoxin system prevent-host-death family antitoxin [Thermoleophilia bacterium]|nr:type II toxin-antitoxin system prevent-host-death family antitoxin [Thermoleophilia bacterium]